MNEETKAAAEELSEVLRKMYVASPIADQVWLAVSMQMAVGAACAVFEQRYEAGEFVHKMVDDYFAQLPEDFADLDKVGK